MKWKIELWPKALNDYFNALDYLSYFYPGTPKRFDKAFEKAKQRLEDNPRCYSSYPGNPAYRRALIGKYIMLYKIDDERHEVHIHRILRSSWDVPNLLPQPEEDGEG